MAYIAKHLTVAVMLLAATAANQSVQGPESMRAVDRTRLDTTCAPCKDFYRFANGAWLDTVKIPSGLSEWGPLPELRQRNQLFIAEVLDSLAFAPTRHARSSLERKIGTFYRSCIDSSSSTTDARAALGPELDRLRTIRSPTDLGRAVGRIQRLRVRAVFNIGQTHDDSERTGILAYAFFNAFSLPLASYLGTDTTTARVRDNFVIRVTRVFERLGESPESAAANARRVLAFEVAMRRTRLVDSGVVWLPMTVVAREGPAFGWYGFARELGKPDLATLAVRPRALPRAIDSLATNVHLDDWKAYLRWRLVSALAPVLDGNQGASERQRRQRCGLQTTLLLRDGVARAYVDRAFPPEARAAAMRMTEDMRGVLRDRVREITWLGQASRHRAVAKIDSMRLWIGYPDRMDELSGLDVRDGSFSRNQLAARRYATTKEISLVGTRIDRNAWIESNIAMADGSYVLPNALLITAAQLQPPFFDTRAEPAANFGNIGYVMGHELTHAFGPENRRYNELGQPEEWWTQDEVREYDRLLDILVRQYDQYIIVDSIRQNGRRTVTENFADIGGVTLAFEAFTRAIRGQPHSVIDGFTPEQRFFIAYAQGINTNVEASSLYATQALADQYGHSAAKWRVNGPLSHLPAFAAAFGCRPGDPMVRADSVRWTVW